MPTAIGASRLSRRGRRRLPFRRRLLLRAILTMARGGGRVRSRLHRTGFLAGGVSGYTHDAHAPRRRRRVTWLAVIAAVYILYTHKNNIGYSFCPGRIADACVHIYYIKSLSLDKYDKKKKKICIGNNIL